MVAMAAAGRVAALSAVVVAALAVAPLFLAGVARADCFDYCYKNCIANDRSMADYCNYACDKTCEPGAPQRPLLVAAGGGGGDMGCQLSCARASCSRMRADGYVMEACFGRCYDGCETKALPRPLRAGVSTASGPVSELVPRLHASEPDTGDAVQPASEPDKDDALRPASAVVRPASVPDHPFQEKEKLDSIQPASKPNPRRDAAVRPAWGPVTPSTSGPEINAAPPAPV